MPQTHPTTTAARSFAPQVAQGTLAILAALQVGLVVNSVRRTDASRATEAANSQLAAAASRRLALAPKAPVVKPAAVSKAAPPASVQASATTIPSVNPAPKVAASSTRTQAAPSPASATSSLPPRDPAALLQMSGLAPSSNKLAPPPAVAPPITPAPSPTLAPALAPAAPAAARRPALPAGKQLSEPKIVKMVEDARQVRRSGDIQAAIQAFKAADILQPNHPEILSELALTYEALGLSDKSQAAWSRVRSMGEEGAGGYYKLAASKLDGVDPVDASAPAKAVALGECNISMLGTKTVLHVPMTAAQGQAVDPNAMDIQVFFFEKVDGQRVELAPQSRSGEARWASANPQWAPDKPEVLEVDYTPPVPGSSSTRHEYHGYMVKLYYKDKLMGEQADPPALLKFRPQQAGSAGADNALLPPIK